jgi:competence ComEA-like helix-hairpin-helix protein
MNLPPVKINIDDQETIARLHGIGTKLAKRIIEYRNKGSFNNIKDLAKVTGVGAALAETLSPHIDWVLPTEDFQNSTVSPKKTTFTNILNEIFIAAFLLGLVIYNYGRFSVSIEHLYIHFHDSRKWTEALYVWNSTSIFAMSVFALLADVAHALNSNLSNESVNKRLKAIFVIFVGLLVLSILSLGIANAFNYQFNTPKGWKDFFDDSSALGGLLAGIGLFFFFLPLLILFIKPSLIKKKLLIRFIDLCFVLTFLTQVFSIFFGDKNQLIIINIVQSLIGVIMMVAAIRYMITKGSFINMYLSLIPFERDLAQPNNSPRLILWLNSKLPDPEEQKALKDALNELYPSSKRRTVLYAFILVAGTWFFLQSLGAIIQWFIGKSLDQFFKGFTN